MVNTESVVVFITLVLFVVGELCGVSRNMDIREIAYEKRKPYIINQKFKFTNLGRFPAIHFINMLILPSSVLLVVLWAEGVIGGILTLLIVPTFLFLPFLEVEEYDKLTENGSIPESFLYHFLTSFVLFILIMGILLVRKISPTIAVLWILITFSALIFGPIMITRTYTALLQDDFVLASGGTSRSWLIRTLRSLDSE